MSLSEALTPHLNLWLERDGQVVLSVWRVQLLAAIEQTGSISAAAERMQVQYRLAWDRLDEMDAAWVIGWWTVTQAGPVAVAPA